MTQKPKLYIANVSCLREEEAYNTAYDMASAARKIKTDKYRRESDRILSLGAEMLIRKLLEDCGIAEPELAYDINGAPYVAGCEEIHISISHSGEYVLCAAAGTRIGCDIEKPSDMSDAELQEMSAQFMTVEEMEALKSHAGHSEKMDCFYRLWTRKESYLKAIGLGLSALKEPVRPGYSFYEYDVPGYRASVCIEAGTEKPELKHIELLSGADDTSAI